MRSTSAVTRHSQLWLRLHCVQVHGTGGRSPFAPSHLWGSPSHLYRGYLRVKCGRGHDAGLSPPSRAAVKKTGDYISSPPKRLSRRVAGQLYWLVTRTQSYDQGVHTAYDCVQLFLREQWTVTFMDE